MKAYLPKIILSLAIATIGASALEAAGMGSAATNTPAPNATIPLSVFESDLASGKDPFFPHSGRRAVEVTANKGSGSADPTSLMLQGLSHSAKRPMATINNQSFQAGDEGEVVTANGRMRIRCIEVKPNSVIISVGGGQPLELKMPQKY